MDTYIIRPIAYIRSDYNEKFGIPRQCGLVEELEQTIVFEPEFSNPDAVRGLNGFTHIWLIWGFSGNVIDMEEDPVKWHPTVRPPRLGGNERMGVWATRSPYRPNSLGLSSVKLREVSFDSQSSRLMIKVCGADLRDNTPIFDIKPYIPYSDCHPDASKGFTGRTPDPDMEVIFPEHLLEKIDSSKRAGLIHVLRLDPRGAYEKQPGSVFGLSFADWDIRFRAEENKIIVIDVISAGDADSEKAK